MLLGPLKSIEGTKSLFFYCFILPLCRRVQTHLPTCLKRNLFCFSVLINSFRVLECCRRRLFFVKKLFFGPGVLPQAPFFMEKMRFWPWNVAAGAFFCEKAVFLYLFAVSLSKLWLILGKRCVFHTFSMCFFRNFGLS